MVKHRRQWPAGVVGAILQVAWLVSLGAALSATSADTPTVPVGVSLTVDEDCGLLVPVTIDGRQARLLLDTGASHSSLRPAVARRLGLASAGEVTLVSTAASRRVPAAMLPHLGMPNVTIRDLPVLLFEPASGSTACRAVDGVLGQDVLARFNYSLDLRRGTLRIEMDDELETTVRGLATRFARVGQRPTIAAILNRDRARPVSLALDSGASHLVLFDRGTGTVDGVERGAPARLLTQAGQIVAPAARVRLLEAGAIRLHELTGVVVEVTDRHEDGLLPLHLFDEIYVNNRLGWLVLNPRWDPHGRIQGPVFAGIPAPLRNSDR